MSSRRFILPLVASLCATAGMFAQGSPLSRLSDPSKVKRGGWRITTEGGEEGTQSVYIPPKEERQAAGALPKPSGPVSPVTPGPNRGALPTPAGAAAEKTAAGSDASRFMRRTETDEPDAALNKLSRTESRLGDKRRDKSMVEGFDGRFDQKERISHDMWANQSDRFGREKSERYDTGSRFDAPRLDMNRLEYDKLERKAYERAAMQAGIRNGDTRLDKPVAGRFTSPDSRMTLQERMAVGYDLLSKVSMQDINRYQFRRNRSDEKGALPVTKPGSEAMPQGGGR